MRRVAGLALDILITQIVERPCVTTLGLRNEPAVPIRIERLELGVGVGETARGTNDTGETRLRDALFWIAAINEPRDHLRRCGRQPWYWRLVR